MRFQDGVVQAVAEAQEGFPGVLEVPLRASDVYTPKVENDGF